MKIRVADFVAKFLIDNGITDVFSVVGGGAMYLNDAFGNTEDLHVTYNHHEQASAIAAESYARVAGRIAVVCVTTGPGGTNAMTGVLCGYQDSIPMLIISGQVRYNTTVESTGLDLRQFGEQEFPIVPAVRTMTKYAEMVRKPEEIKYHLQKALYMANEGRKGPCWIDIPLDIQGAIVETDDLREFVPVDNSQNLLDIDLILNMLRQSERPVVLAGESIRYSGGYDKFLRFADKYKLPVLATASTADLMAVKEECYYGTIGSFGGRAGNFIVQNSDLIIAIGCRLSFKQIGFNYQLFAPDAKKIVVDVDEGELQKDTVRIDFPINVDLKVFLDCMNNVDQSVNLNIESWIEYCDNLKRKYPIYQNKFEKSIAVNPYYFTYELNRFLPDDSVVVLGNSVACVCVMQMGVEKKGQRLYTNKNCGTMGYDIPAAIGASIAKNGEAICVTGDGSFQMNIQELQTIVYNKLPVKLIVFNNGGYQAIVQTQTNFFQRLSGCTSDCGLGMPSFERIAYAYDIPYVKIEKNSDVVEGLKKFFNNKTYAICELIQDTSQGIEPRSKSMKTKSGEIVSPPIDNLYPFLPDNEYDACKYRRGELC